ncbi:helix-turn-helix domain-containing protein [Caulobacter sp.]|uniref:helix-turn-helix domain-containing protein n=1 Tax=Caulobacter sp. TaxID=78 RepID=UPI003BAA7E7B
MEKGVPIRSISRSIAVMQAINRDGPLSMMDIANASHVPYPTACRIVQTLLYEGLIEREPARKRYRPTALVQSLSYGYQSHDELVTRARPHIVGLTKSVGWPVSLVTRVGQCMIVRDSTHALTSMTLNNYYPGYALPLLECASGLAHLAFCSAEERRALLAGIRESDVPVNHNTMQLLEGGQLVDEIRREGIATNGRNRHTLNPGKTSSIAAPVFANGQVAGVMTLIFFASAIKMTEAVRTYAPMLKRVAADIGLELESGQPVDLRAA